jgi:transposase-like protein
VKKQSKNPRRQPRTKRSDRRAQSPGHQEIVPFHQEIRALLVSKLRGAVVATAQQLVEDEVTSLVGPMWSRKGDTPLRRGGSTRARVFLEGEPVHIKRPRVRDVVSGTEHPLISVAALSSRDALDEDVHRLIARGITTRKYDAALGRISDGLGLKKSAVSAAFQRAAQKDLDALNDSPLGGVTFAAVYIDGVGFGDTTCIVAMGVSIDGTKRILGVRDGASENSTVVVDLLDNLEERGLTLTSRALFVLDGSKALRKAVKSKYGDRALVQRCHIHKIRNVLAYLPPSKHSEARRRMRVALGMERLEDANAEMGRVVSWLRSVNSSAAESLEEGFDELLTVHALGVGGTLRRSLVTTNPIESAFDTVRSVSRRVKRWRDAAMAMRWAGTGLAAAQSQFRRLKGCRQMAAFVATLEGRALQATKDVA